MDIMYLEIQLYVPNRIFSELSQCALPALTSDVSSYTGIEVMHLLEMLQSLISMMCRGESQGIDSKLGK